MAGFGGFYKGEKKKPKKGKGQKQPGLSSAPVFTLPEVITKKKKDW